MFSPRFYFNLFTNLIIFIILTTTVISAKQKNTLGPEINITKHLSFTDFGPNNPTTTNQDITLLGSASISSQTGCLQIPENNLQYSAGRAIYSSPIRLFDPNTRTPASFNTTFSFQIHNPSNTPGPVSGGLSFIIVPDEFTVGRPGPWLAMLNDVCEDESKVVAVEFDTRMNPEFGDPNDNHVGINLGSIVSSVAINASNFGLRLNDGMIHRAWLIYDGNRRFLEIYLGPDEISLPAKSAYSGNLDLSPYLNEYMFVGFSGSTGDNHTEIHSICSWNFTSVSRAFLRVPSSESCEGKIIVDKDYENVSSKTPSSFYIFVAVVVLMIITMINLYFNRKPKRRNDYSEYDIAVVPKEKQRPGPPTRARKFHLAEISSATRALSELQILGSDGRSVTYKGTLVNGCNVAVKRFNSQFYGARAPDRRRMIKEVKAAGKIRHPNIVSIRGWCFDRQETIVVYDFVPNGSLDKWLFGFGVLPWTRRFKVVKDVAEALSYIHSKDLAHKNVKTSSVFLDISFRALVGDFGFVLSSVDSTRFESLVGQKVDIFEFGVLLLEVVSGRGRRSDPGELGLLDLAWAMHETGEKSKLVDRRMGPVVNPDQAIRALEVGLMCTLNDNKGRPTMEEVVEYLNFERPVPELPTNRPVSLFPYSSTTGLCSGYSCAPF
ncbi:probable L-type lectin-domain containing receptor kinase s.7 [Phtheirospermum japonicum]|uniref:non-specific serine/threonine protein kinase n=1 Tax=Phtheirospermum japonicum TaxID=374723 RepID=A0A830C3V6_9LAMI|nr:probable L-type lectin-domain containing receptor kinase s.7 [Phtheirospermum japonicum]GFQ08095.1 probable L-type lectin-domain containing receptor kinase s.7 [Phtheirospermum japonicum]